MKTTSFQTYVDSDGNTVEIKKRNVKLFGITVKSKTITTVYFTSQTITL